MKTLKEANLKGKKVLVRCDFNLSIEDGEIVDDFRITQTLPTIKRLKNQGAKIILASHFGRPENQKSFKKEGFFSSLKDAFDKPNHELSLKPIHEKLNEYLEVDFAKSCVGKSVGRKVNNLENGEVILLENLRFYEDELENGKEFARALSELADVYVNDAFSASHRKHASLHRLPAIMDEVFPGLLFERELKFLRKLKKDVERPFVVVVGGAKVDSKIKTIREFLNRADHVLLGGKVANIVLNVRGLAVNKPLPPKSVVEKLEEIELTAPNLHLPADVVVSTGPDATDYVRQAGVGEVRKDEEIFDIGHNTVKIYSDIIKEAETILWAGPLGYFEKDDFAFGTREIAERMVKNREALKVVGGGDTSYALEKFSVRDFFDHVSVGGGAMLSFLSDKKMPGMENLPLE